MDGTGLYTPWTLAEYRQECGDTIDDGRFIAIAVNGGSFVVYDWNHILNNTELSVWKRGWVVLRKSCAGILIDVRFADKPFIQWEPDSSYCCRL